MAGKSLTAKIYPAPHPHKFDGMAIGYLLNSSPLSLTTKCHFVHSALSLLVSLRNSNRPRTSGGRIREFSIAEQILSQLWK